MSETKCQIWRETPAEELFRDAAAGNGAGMSVFNSPRAGGEYSIIGAGLNALPDDMRVLLTNWLVEQRRRGCKRPMVNIRTMVDLMTVRPPSVHERADSLLRYLRAKSDLLSTTVEFQAVEDAAKRDETANELLAWTGSLSMSEVIYLATYCAQEGWITHDVPEQGGLLEQATHAITLMPPGHARLDELDGIGSQST